MYRGNRYMQTISINKKFDYSTPILFVPYATQTPKAKLPTVTPVASKPSLVKTTANASPGTAAIASIKKPTTIAAPAKTIATKTEMKIVPVVEKKKDTSSFAKASSSAKATADKSADSSAGTSEAKAADVKKKEPKKIQEIEQKPAPSLAKALDTESPIIPVQPEAHQIGVPVQNNVSAGVLTQEKMEHGATGHGVKDNAIISNNYREVEALRRGAQLQKELVHKWHPPIGVSPDCTCEISFFINNKGTIENLKMVKGSGVMMFDISARQALFAMKMPQWTYGNPLTISFKQ